MDHDYVRALEYGMPPTGGVRHRHRPAGDAAHRLALDPRRDPVPAAPARGGAERDLETRRETAPPEPPRPRPGTGAVNFPLWIAARYLRTRRQSGFITLLTGISIGGVALGVTALLTVLAVMNGFENEIQTRIAGTDAHVVLLGETTAGVHERRCAGGEASAREPGVLGVAPFTYVKAMVFREGLDRGDGREGRRSRRRARGHDGRRRNIEPPLDSIPRRDRGRAAGHRARHRARRAARAPRSGTRCCSPRSTGERALRARLRAAGCRPFRVVGIFTSGLYTYDSSFGFTSIAASQEFFELGVGGHRDRDPARGHVRRAARRGASCCARSTCPGCAPTTGSSSTGTCSRG